MATTIISSAFDRDASEKSIERDYKTQLYLKEISTLLSSNDNISENIQKVVSMIGEFLGLERICVYELYNTGDQRYAKRTETWTSENLNEPPLHFRELPSDCVDSFYSWFNNGGNYSLRDVSQYDDALCNKMASFNVKSALGIPLYCGENLDGVLCMQTLNMYRDWTPAEVNFATTVGGMISTALSRETMQKEIISERDRANEASLAKGQFLSSMSHEIRTPLNAVIGMTKIAQLSDNKEKKEYCLSKIDDASRHLLGLINNILDMSKIEADKLEIVDGEFNFEKMIEKICSVMSVKAEEKDIRLLVNVKNDVPRDVIGDELRISQVMVNLLSNAIKFTPNNGQIQMNLIYQKELENNTSLVMCEIVDNGIGMTEEQRSKLFNPFVQASKDTAKKYGGTGLGLAISKQLVEMMGGEIGVASKVNMGSRFHFTIKLKHSQKSYDLRNIKSIYKGVRVLVVDDDQNILDYFTQVLSNFDMTLGVCTNGYDAIKTAKNAYNNGEPFDIIFVDYLMYELNGIETVRRMKKEIGDCFKVIMVSISDWTLIEAEAAEAGITSFISKPLFGSSILDAINTHVFNKNVLGAVKNSLTSPEATFSKCNLLLVEDVDINREIAMTFLEETKIHIDCAENGLIALDMFKDDPCKYDIILMDMQMPVMGGLESTRLIRALDMPQAKTIPIVAMTANAFKEDIENCLAAGMNDHICKPIEIEDLHNKVIKYIQDKKD